MFTGSSEFEPATSRPWSKCSTTEPLLRIATPRRQPSRRVTQGLSIGMESRALHPIIWEDQDVEKDSFKSSEREKPTE